MRLTRQRTNVGRESSKGGEVNDPYLDFDMMSWTGSKDKGRREEGPQNPKR